MMNIKLEVLVIPVSEVDRAKAFYEKLGFRLDIDYVPDDKFRVLQFTPPGSEASIIFGKGITSKKPGSADGLTLAVEDVDAVRKDLIARGVAVSEVFHYAGGPFNDTGENPRVGGRDPEGALTFRSHLSRILMATVGCSRKFRRGFPVANGSRSEHRQWTSQRLQNSSARRRSAMTITRRPTPNIAGGIGTRLT